MKRYFYFRTVTAIGDDDSIDDSVLVDVDRIVGFHCVTDTVVQLFFESINNHAGGTGELIERDNVALTVNTTKTREVIQALAEATNNGPHEDGIIVIADDVTGTYIHPDITACSTIGLAEHL